jgi:predicted transcriptional regulator
MAAATTLKLSAELKARISAMAEAQGMTPHAYMVEALEREAARAEDQRDSLAAGDTALSEYQRTGVAYAIEDVAQYILAKAEGKNPRRP